MTNKTRRHIWPLALMSLAVVGALAVVVALSMGAPQPASAHDCDAISDPIEKAQCITLHQQQGEDHGQATPTPEPTAEPTPEPQVGGAPDSYVIEGPGFVDQRANSTSDYVLVVTDEDGLNPDYSQGGNMVRVRFTRHDAVPSIDEAGDIVVGCLPDNARLADTGLQGQLTASLQSGVAGQVCSITMDLAVGDDSFTIYATTVPNNTRLGISLSVVDGSLVDTHTVTFLNPQEAPPPPPDPDVEQPAEAGCYSVVGYGDENRDDLTDPTMPAVDAEVGQNTVQVLNGSDSVQLTVISCQEGPVYIRFIDRNGATFGTDVDECDDPCVDAAGADVVGLDSQGRLELNLMKNLDAAQALAYDQYTLININPESANPMERLVGKADNYYAGSFRLYDPCDWGPFQVEVHEPDGKKRVTLQNGMMSETVSCVPPAIADPTEFSVTVHTGIHGLATVRWAAIPGSVRYHVAALDTTNPNMWTVAGYEIVDGGATREVRFTGLMSGTTYLFVTIGEQANGTYSIPRSLLQTTVYR